MTKNSEIKWDKTKGNRNVSIKPLSSSGDLQSPVWGSDRGVGVPQDPIGSGLSLELHMLVHQSWIRRERLKTNPSSNFHCFLTCTILQMSSSKYTPSATRFGLSLAGNPEWAVYCQSYRTITRSMATNLAHAESNPTHPYLTTNEVRLWI